MAGQYWEEEAPEEDESFPQMPLAGEIKSWVLQQNFIAIIEEVSSAIGWCLARGEDRYLKAFEGAITVCNSQTEIVYMNSRSVETFGPDRIGSKLGACHKQESSLTMIESLLSSTPRYYAYTVKTAAGVCKLILQLPLELEGKVNGLIELSLVVDETSELPEFGALGLFSQS